MSWSVPAYMDNFYERLLELFGKSPRHKLVRHFLREIEEVPIVEKLGSLRLYKFPRLGLEFDHDVSFGYIWAIGLYFGDSDGWEEFHGWQQFQETLPAGISANDTREDVRRKLDMNPVRSGREQRPVQVPPNLYGEALKKWTTERAKAPYVTETDLYHLPPHKLNFKFRLADGKLILINIFNDKGSL